MYHIPGDDTDDESKPKRTVPTWARNKLTLNESLRKQFSGNEKHSAKTIFGPYPKTADLDQLFGTVNRVRDRQSHFNFSVSSYLTWDYNDRGKVADFVQYRHIFLNHIFV